MTDACRFLGGEVGGEGVFVFLTSEINFQMVIQMFPSNMIYSTNRWSNNAEKTSRSSVTTHSPKTFPCTSLLQIH